MSKEFTRKVFAWLGQVLLDRGLPPSAFKIAYLLGQKFNEGEGGEAWPSNETIAIGAAVAKGTVNDMIGRLRERGHLAIDPGKHGRGHSHRYRMILKGQPAELLDDGKGQPTEQLKGQPAELSARRKGHSAKIKGQFTEIKGQPAEQTHSIDSPKELTKESKTPSAASDLFNGAPVESPSASKKNPKPSKAAIDDAFARFWAVYPSREGGESPARARFARTMKGGADPEVIIKAAAHFAAKEAGRDAQYIAYAKNWLRDERWLDEVARPNGGAVTIDGKTGDVIEPAHTQRDGNFRSFAEAAAAKQADEARRGRG